MKYPQLTRNMCKRCYGCSKLENSYFKGQAKCDLAVDPRDRIKNILGIQEKIQDE